MQVAIDISPLNSGHKGRGIGIYTKELIEALKTYEPQHTYTLVTGKNDVTHDVDIVHYPFFDPFFLTLPLQKKKPTVVTVHDLIPLIFPDKFPAGIRGAIKWQIQKTSLMGAKRIITDSDASKRDIVKITGFNEQHIDRVYLAPSSQYTPIQDAKRLSEVVIKYALPKQFILYVGDVNWNKNIPRLLQAVKKIHGTLVLVGKAFMNDALKETQDINDAIKELGIEKQIIKTGYIADEELICLYALAQCLVEPSLYEGFGLPILEAFACGCPVVAADNSSLSEIMGPAIKISAESFDEIAGGIEKIVGMSVNDRRLLQQKQFSWVKQFTWKKTAHETVIVYERSMQ